MSENHPPQQPTPDQPGPQFAPPGQPAQPQTAAPGAQPTPPKKRRTGVIATAAVVGVAVIGGGIALALNLAKGGDMNAADGLPSDAVFAAEVNLNPPAGDQLALRDIAKKFPNLEMNTETTDYKEALFSLVAGDTEDVDYATDVKPWLGDSAAIGVVNSTDFSPYDPDDSIVFVVDTTDASKAEEFFTKKNDDADMKHFFVDDLLVIHPVALDLSADAIKAAPLSASQEYTSMKEKLGGGLVTAYVSPQAIPMILESMDDPEIPELPAALQQEIGASGVALQVTDNMLSAKIISTSPEAMPEMVDVRDFAGALDGESVFALAASLPAEAIEKNWDVMTATPEMAEILPLLGIQSAADFSALFGEQLGLSLKSLDAPEPVIGIKVKPADVDRHTALLENLELQLGMPLSREVRDGYSGISISPAGLESALAPATALKDNASYTKLTELSGSVNVVMFVNVDPIRDMAGALGTDPSNFEALAGVGIVGSRLDDHTSEVQLRVAFN
ncbi:DUF3352 domain-containing protein [Tessaracoccus caeni]|uniref:DUF3352 domain-containing protein n=1 Tax=Tessaracoccus caeni TaxID=3031239 RepID=UPI0023DBF447|nr:DUF3352 domain-containing protein [Tessaracoccus caeni]MDF1488912.1 DUF3352 domain-containing protein [Tessaracoccus caeni]